ncbi:MAG: hypothetical protein MUC60_19160 [Oscillatoria sp. Prado101]|nr:hypothetical protein [Oscillatoria sp. Prado101]
MPRRLAQPDRRPYLIRAITDSQSTIFTNWQAVCQAVWLCLPLKFPGCRFVWPESEGTPHSLPHGTGPLGPRYSSQELRRNRVSQPGFSTRA